MQHHVIEETDVMGVYVYDSVLFIESITDSGVCRISPSNDNKLFWGIEKPEAGSGVCIIIFYAFGAAALTPTTRLC